MRVEGGGGSEVGVGDQSPALARRRVLARPQEAGRGRPLLPARARPEGHEGPGLGPLLQRDAGLDDRDRPAGATPSCGCPRRPCRRIGDLSATARWLGQDGQDMTGPGDVHVRLSGLARTPSFIAAVLTDSVRGTWVYRKSDRVKPPVPEGQVTGPLAVRPGGDRGTIDLFFAPYRDETGSTLTLRLIDQDGRMSVARFDGGACDLARRAPRPAATRVQASPGDDLSALANQYGTVSLAPGTYRTGPPPGPGPSGDPDVGGEGDPGLCPGPDRPSVDGCHQDPCRQHHPQWVRGAVRGPPARWDQDVSYGPAVIGTTDRQGPGPQRSQGEHHLDSTRPRGSARRRPVEVDRGRRGSSA